MRPSLLVARPTLLSWVTALLYAAAGLVAAVYGQSGPTLVWRNGDSLAGFIQGGDSSELVWQSPSFADPLRVDLNHLHLVRFPPNREVAEAIERESSQIIETRDGNRFFGHIDGADEQYVDVTTPLFGKIRLLRSDIGLIANPIERAHVYSGPRGLRGWSTLTYGRRLSEWEEIGVGRLSTRMVAAELFRSLPAKGSVDIELELLWRNNPSFQIRFLTPYANPTKETVKVETRVNGFVVQTLGSSGRFRQIDTIPKGEKKCRLLLRWNHAAGELSVFRGRTYLGKITVENGVGSGNAGIYLKNTGPQLTLSRLEVRASSSLDMSLTDPSVDTVLQADNKPIAGIVESVSADSVELRRGDNVTSLRWANIAEIVFRQQESALKLEGNTAECIFQNGETLKGAVLSSTVDGMQIRVPAIDRPLHCRFEVLERIVLGPKTLPAVKGAAAIEVDGQRLHGQLAAGSDQKLAWLPIGGSKPAVFHSGADTVVTLRPTNRSSAGSPQEDLVYLRNGDVIPCQVLGVGDNHVSFSSVYTQQRELDADGLHAIEFSVKEVAPLNGFDESWDVSEPESVTSNANEVDFRGPASISRSGLLYGYDRIQFQLKHKYGKGGIFLHVGLKGENGVKDVAVPMYFMDAKLFVLGSKRNAFIPCRTDAEHYDVVIETHDPFSVTVNDKLVYSVPGNTNGGPWSGLSFDVSDGPLFGPPLRRKDQKINVAIANLKIRQTKRASIRQTTASIQSEPLLTIPRNRKPASMTHLAIGGNNDAVRGNLVGLDDTSLTMACNDKHVTLPRAGVAGLIWLHQEKEPGEQSAETVSAPFHRVVLTDTTTISLKQAEVTTDEIVGQHPLLGVCRIPRNTVHAILHGGAPNRHHQYAFLGWQTRASRQPDFATNGGDGHRIESHLEGKPIGFDAQLLASGRNLDLDAYHGKIVVLDFWASWCAPCIRNMPRLVDCVAKFGGDRAKLVAVNQGEDPGTVAAVVASKQWNNLVVATDLLGTATQELRIEALPQTVILNQQGKVSAVFVGASARLHEEIADEIKRLLGE